MNPDNTASEFFTAGGTLPLDAPSYVKRPTDDELYRHIMAGEFCYVLTPRQMGKSSLMIRTSQRLSQAGVRSAIVDLTQTGTVDNEDQWYKGILTQIKRRLRVNIDPVVWWEQRRDIPSIQKFIEFFEDMLSEIKEPVVVFIDEIDTTLKLGFRDDFFAGIRSIFNARAENSSLNRITFVLLGVASPSDLIKDRNRTPFNIGQEISLKPFSREDARMLENGLEEVYPKMGQKILDRIFYWTNGHPYLTQKLCQGVVEKKYKQYTDQEIDLLVRNLFTSEEASRETNLQFVRDNVLSYPERRVILSLYKKILRGLEVRDNKNSLPQNHLKLSGLARTDDGKIVISNKIYGTVFNQRWVNRYIEFDWRYPVIGFLLLVVMGFSFIFFNDGIRLPNQAATRVNGIPIYKDDRGIRYLADLFRMDPYIFPNEYEYQAKNTFFNELTSWDDQKSLIDVVYGEPHPSKEDYAIVVSRLYSSLADVDKSGDTTKLLEIIYHSLEEMQMENEPIYREIGYWLSARNSVNRNDFENALMQYSSAIEINNQNPATLFERARVYASLRDYPNAMKDYEQVVAIAPSIVEPTESEGMDTQMVTSPFAPLTSRTPTAKSTSTVIPLSILTSTPQLLTNTPDFIFATDTPIPLVSNTPTLTTTPTGPSVSRPIQSRFLTRRQRIAAVQNDIDQNDALIALFFLSAPGDYPNIATNIPIPMPSPTFTPTARSTFTVVPSFTSFTNPPTPSHTATIALTSTDTPSPTDTLTPTPAPILSVGTGSCARFSIGIQCSVRVGISWIPVDTTNRICVYVQSPSGKLYKQTDFSYFPDRTGYTVTAYIGDGKTSAGQTFTIHVVEMPSCNGGLNGVQMESVTITR